MEKTELEGLLLDEKAFAEYVYTLHQQNGEQVFDPFITELLDLKDPTLLHQLLQNYSGCVVSIAKILSLISADVEPKSAENQDVLASAERKRQRTLSMEAFMLRFYQYGIDKAKQPTLDLAEYASLETGDYWLQDGKAQETIKEFLKQCKLHLSSPLAGIAHAYLCDIAIHENMKPLLPRDTAVLLCPISIGAITLSKGTTGVVIQGLSGSDVNFLVDNSSLTREQSNVRIDRKYLNLMQPKADEDMFDLAPHEREIVKELAANFLNGVRDDIVFAVTNAQAKRLLMPMFYEALRLDTKHADIVVRKILKMPEMTNTSDIQDAFQTASVRMLLEKTGKQ